MDDHVEFHFLRTPEEITEYVNSRPLPNEEDMEKLRKLFGLGEGQQDE